MQPFLLRLIGHLWIHAGWAGLAVCTLAITYAIDPYVFGAAALLLAWITLLMLPLSLFAALATRDRSPGWRIAVAASGAGAATVVAIALLLLRTFRWA